MSSCSQKFGGYPGKSVKKSPGKKMKGGGDIGCPYHDGGKKTKTKTKRKTKKARKGKKARKTAKKSFLARLFKL